MWCRLAATNRLRGITRRASLEPGVSPAHIGYARPVTGPRPGRPRHGHCFLINLSLSLSLSPESLATQGPYVRLSCPGLARARNVSRHWGPPRACHRAPCCEKGGPSGPKESSGWSPRFPPVRAGTNKGQRSHARRPPLGQPQLNVPRERSRPRGRPLQPFGLWRICFPPVLVRTGRRLPVQALGERGVLVSVTGYPRGGAPGPG